MYTKAVAGVLQFHTHIAPAGGGEGGGSVADERTYISTPGAGRMEHLACFTGGMVAMGAATAGKEGTQQTTVQVGWWMREWVGAWVGGG
jgi:hypothetical protein